MSKSKEEIKSILSGDDSDRFSNIQRDSTGRTHIQMRRYIDLFESNHLNTCTYDWYDAPAWEKKHLENYVCTFLSVVENMAKQSEDFALPQKRNPYYFTQCGNCGYIILTNRDIGKKLVCMNPRESCQFYNQTQPLPNDQVMSDVLELVNEYFKLNSS